MGMSLSQKIAVMRAIHKLIAKHPGVSIQELAKLYGGSANEVRHWVVKLEADGHLRHDWRPANHGSVKQHLYFVTDKPLAYKMIVKERIGKAAEQDQRSGKSPRVYSDLPRAFFGPARAEVQA